MSSAEENIINTLVQSMQGEKKPEAYDTGATITRIEDGIAWVHIPGGVDETPVKLTISAEVGDEVQVRVSGGQAFLVGNATAPPTDDKVANKAVASAKKAIEATDELQKYFWHDLTGTHISVEKGSDGKIYLMSGENIIATFSPSLINIGGSRFDPELGYTYHTNPPFSVFGTLTLSVSSGILSSLIKDTSGMLMIKSDDGTVGGAASIDLNLGDILMSGNDLKWNGTSLISQISNLTDLLSGMLQVQSLRIISSSTTIAAGGNTGDTTVTPTAISGYTPILATPRNTGGNGMLNFYKLYMDADNKVVFSLANPRTSAVTFNAAYVNVLYVKSELVGSPSQMLTVSQDPSTGVLSIS